MAKKKYVAKTNLFIGEGPREDHHHVKKGEVFEASEDWADEHLDEHHAEEAEDDAPVTKTVKAQARRETKAKKKAAAKKAKEAAAPKKDEAKTEDKKG
jgi:hypothetical protein